MESKRTATTYFIPPGKFLLMENALGNPDLIQSSVSSDCRVTIVDSANFPLDELEQWPTFRLTSADIKLKLGDGAYYIYIVVPTPDNTESTSAFISYNTALVDRDGYEVIETEDEEGNPKLEKGELLGKSGFKYYQCGVISARGGNASAITAPAGQGRLLSVDLGVNPQDANLDKKVDWDFFYSLFKPHYDDPKDPTKLTWIEVKSHMGIQGGAATFIEGEGMDLPSIYDGLPIDMNTIYWELDENGNKLYLKAKEGTLGGLLNVGEWADQVAVTDRIMVQKAGSEVWEGMDIANIGTASFENIEEYGEGNAFTSFLVTEGTEGEKLYLLKDKTFAEQSYLEENYFTKDDASELFVAKEDAPGMFVTLDKTSQDIEGVKNFIGELQINGCPIEYDRTYKYWKFTGDLVVTGGIASFSSDTARDFASIMDGVVVDGRTILNEGGILMLNPELTLGGEGGGEMNTVAWGNIQGKPTTIKGYGITDAYTKTEADELLAKKWTADNAKIQNWDTAFGWGDHNKAGYTTKKYVDDTFVTIGGETVQNITGAKNFTGGLQVNGCPIVYDAQKKYWKFEGDLLITGGIASFSSDMAYDPISIMDGILTDDVTIRVNKTTKQLEVIGGGSGGGLSESQVRNIVESYNYLTSVPVATSSVKGIASFSSDFSISDGHVSFNGAKVKVVGASDPMNESGTLYIVV